MANTISNMRNPIRGLVSKHRKRYQKDGFNLDLAYILPNLIAMGFPAEKLEGVYRNHIDDVYKFLENKHSDVYRIYNLCSERSYDTSRFHNRVGEYPFDDHNPPKIELIQAFCDDVHQWLNADPTNIAAVHCKAGKGRTGTMICCFMLHDGRFETAADSLRFYDEKRTHDRKGVTIPSQIRYVEYYARLIKSGKTYVPVSLQICELILSPPPIFNSYQGSVYFNIYDSNGGAPLHSANIPDFKKSHGNNSDGFILIKLDRCIPLSGDIKVEFYSKTIMRKDKLFHFWFNTYFANELANKETIPSNGEPQSFIYKLKKNEIDTAHKDKQDKIYPPDFEVQLILQRIPSGTYSRADHIGQDDKLNFDNQTRTPSENSDASSSESSTEEDGLWESGECSTSSSTTTKNIKTTTKNKKKLIDFDVQQQQQQQQVLMQQQQKLHPKDYKSINKQIKQNKEQLQQQSQKSIKSIKQNTKQLQQNFKVKTNIKKKWFTNMRSDPDLREHLIKNVNLRSRNTSETSYDQDYYSLLCDKQLSLGSPITNDYLRQQINNINEIDNRNIVVLPSENIIRNNYNDDDDDDDNDNDNDDNDNNGDNEIDIVCDDDNNDIQSIEIEKYNVLKENEFRELYDLNNINDNNLLTLSKNESDELQFNYFDKQLETINLNDDKHNNNNTNNNKNDDDDDDEMIKINNIEENFNDKIPTTTTAATTTINTNLFYQDTHHHDAIFDKLIDKVYNNNNNNNNNNNSNTTTCNTKYYHFFMDKNNQLDFIKNNDKEMKKKKKEENIKLIPNIKILNLNTTATTATTTNTNINFVKEFDELCVLNNTKKLSNNTIANNTNNKMVQYTPTTTPINTTTTTATINLINEDIVKNAIFIKCDNKNNSNENQQPAPQQQQQQQIDIPNSSSSPNLPSSINAQTTRVNRLSVPFNFKDLRKELRSVIKPNSFKSKLTSKIDKNKI